MKRPRVTVKRDNSEAFAARLKELTSLRVSVGVVGSPAEAAHQDEDGKPSRLTNGEIAAVHEFGASVRARDGSTFIIPMRSFIRAPLDALAPQIQKLMQGEVSRVIAGKLTAQQAFERIGLALVGRLQAAMAQGLPVPPLSPRTIKRKGSSTPLINRGQLRNSITHVVRPK